VTRLATIAALAALLVAGCAGGTAKPKVAPVVPVPTGIVPGSLPAEKLTLQLDTATEVKQAIASVGPQLLVSDARLWELHFGQRLVGALQLATLKPRVNPAHAADRASIVGQILGAEFHKIQVNGLPVWTVRDDGSQRAVYVWFGAHEFGVLQLKGASISPGQVADDLIARIAGEPAWQALPPQVYGP